MKPSFEEKLTQLTAKIVRWFSTLWFKFEPQQSHLIPKIPFLVVSRHTSYLDGIILGAYFLKFIRISPLATAGLFRFPTGIILRGAKAIPIHRGQPFHLQAIKSALQRLETGAVLIFPEGGVRNPYSKSILKAGFLFLAAKSGVPILYCHLENAHAALPPGRFLMRKKNLTLNILKVIYPGDPGYPQSTSRAERKGCLQIAEHEYDF